ncbi:TetR/AcrR family transcriptional regulator [Roseomonas marmotae]|uniref:TetR/AcrR family transcriptional regulator n=1 Tax=Roseomonas marmotae TaxID=2768161 RepID=A0ABS3KHF5_9PROT|nr:TetR/AcrR family transcriptional regulator [Roseomonas marmotae]MBO1076897.1 TetR/AcrR family transcriptional regulator [Roseomonas marmotae]
MPGIRDEVAALKRERTIAAAVDLFYERGYENTTLDAVAERLGVTKPFIYAHFHSKAELLTEICTRGIASALEAIESVQALVDGPTGKLEALGQRFTMAVLQSQMHIAIFSREEKNLPPADFDKISAMRREFDSKLVALLEAGVASGEFNMPDPRMAALAIGGMVSWAYVWYRPNGRLPLPDVAQEMSRLILAMVGAKPATASRAKRPVTAKLATPKRATTRR